MIYKRGCDKEGPNGTCSRCGERRSCGSYWYKFMWQGKLIRESPKQSNDKVARQIEAAHRTSLAKGEVGIREKTEFPLLSEFLKRDFLPYVKAKHAAKPGTVEYYSDGAKMLQNSDAASIALNQVNDQHAQQFAAKRPHL